MKALGRKNCKVMMKKGLKKEAKTLRKAISPRNGENPLMPNARKGSKEVPHSQNRLIRKIIKIGLGPRMSIKLRDV